jgi:hypothetical protein
MSTCRKKSQNFATCSFFCYMSKNFATCRKILLHVVYDCYMSKKIAKNRKRSQKIAKDRKKSRLPPTSSDRRQVPPRPPALTPQTSHRSARMCFYVLPVLMSAIELACPTTRAPPPPALATLAAMLPHLSRLRNSPRASRIK